MKSTATCRSARVLMLLLPVLFLAACDKTPSSASPAQEEATAAAVEPIEPWDGDGMDIPLDGSSLEAFNRSLARVEAHTDKEDYLMLVSAIGYLTVYDLAAKGDRAKLAARLDGMTGYEVIERVDRGRGKR